MAQGLNVEFDSGPLTSIKGQASWKHIHEQAHAPMGTHTHK